MPLAAQPQSDDERPSTGQEYPGLVGFDRMMQSLLAEHDVPGASLAVSKDGRLVYARGFGFADLETRQPVIPSSRFRIASISKPITAVAVLQLVEQDKLRLDDPVFEILDLEEQLDDGARLDARWRQITVQHCLQHTGGWDRGISFDAMFQSVVIAVALKTPPPAKAHDVIRYMLRVPLDFDPGQRYAYSNFGYCLLGRVIERRSQMDYQQYVRQHVLGPLGIKQMQIGATLAEAQADREVKYYQPGTAPAVFAGQIGDAVPHPYGAWHLEAMDSHGAWIASASDLVRFAAALDDPASCAILSEPSIQRMFARPDGEAGHHADGRPKESYYALGWSVRPMEGPESVVASHTGSLPGTSTMLVRRQDGINWAVLFNQRDGRDQRRLSWHVQQRIGRVIEQVEDWPEHDLFQ